MISTDLRGKTKALPGCATCGPSDEFYSYGLGIVTTGNWLIQNPLFSGEAGVFAYLPSQKVAIRLALTFSQDAFAADGSYKPEVTSNAADTVWRGIATVLARTTRLRPRGSSRRPCPGHLRMLPGARGRAWRPFLRSHRRRLNCRRCSRPHRRCATGPDMVRLRGFGGGN